MSCTSSGKVNALLLNSGSPTFFWPMIPGRRSGFRFQPPWRHSGYLGYFQKSRRCRRSVSQQSRVTSVDFTLRHSRALRSHRNKPFRWCRLW